MCLSKGETLSNHCFFLTHTHTLKLHPYICLCFHLTPLDGFSLVHSPAWSSLLPSKLHLVFSALSLFLQALSRYQLTGAGQSLTAVQNNIQKRSTGNDAHGTAGFWNWIKPANLKRHSSDMGLKSTTKVWTDLNWWVKHKCKLLPQSRIYWEKNANWHMSACFLQQNTNV